MIIDSLRHGHTIWVNQAKISRKCGDIRQENLSSKAYIGGFRNSNTAALQNIAKS